MLSVKILGSGCANCAKLEATARQAIDQSGIAAQVEKVTDYGDIMGYHVLVTPALVINEQVVSAGRQPSTAEVTTWLANAA
ncbi:MAG: thioredoxin family protein [Anaerolineae bacterium]